MHIAKALLQAGAIVDMQDVSGETPLHWALFEGYWEVARVLLDYGADMDMTTQHGETPLHRVARRVALLPRCVQSVKAFLGYETDACKKVDPDKINNDGDTALALAHDSQIARELILVGADIDVRNKQHQTAAEKNPVVAPLLAHFTFRSAFDCTETGTMFLL